MAPRKGIHPMSAKSYCACGEFGSAQEPKPLLSVLAHRRHRRHKLCEEPPYVIAADGDVPERAQYPVRDKAPLLAPLEDDAAAAPPLNAPPWTANDVPDTPLGAPPTLSGKAAMPTPDPKAGLPTPAPLFTVSIKITAGVAQLWDWTLAHGFTATFDDWVDQSIKACYRDLVGIAPMIVPVEAA